MTSSTHGVSLALALVITACTDPLAPSLNSDATLLATVDLSSAENPYGARYMSVHFHAGRKVYQMWHLVERTSPEKLLFYAESRDGITFTDVGEVFTVPGKSLYGAMVSFVPHLNKYVLAYAANAGPGNSTQGWENGIALSDDGIIWATLPGAEFRPSTNTSDSPTQVVWNEQTQTFQMMVRPHMGDRQVAIIHSPDLLTWSEPKLVFPKYQTEAVQVQFYGMTVYATRDGWKGLVLRMETPLNKVGLPFGRYQTYLAESRDGIEWSLDESEPLLPVLANGGCNHTTDPLAWTTCPAFTLNRGDRLYGTGAIEATALLRMADGSFRIFASGFLVDHSLLVAQREAGMPATSLLVYQFGARALLLAR
jgi:hypothetical protein